MRTPKIVLSMMLGLMLIALGCNNCGGKKEPEVPSAARQMEKHKKVIIVTTPVNAPFEFGSGTSVQGLGVDVGNEIAKDLNIEVKWIPVKGDYDHAFELLAGGEAEILISSAWIDPKKADKFSFSKPYYETGDVIAQQRGVGNVKDLASLAGKKVGVATGRPADSFMATKGAGATVAKFTTLDEALGALNRTEIDAVVGDQVMIAFSIVNSYANTAKLPNMVNKYQYAAVVRKTDPDLLEKVNKTIDRLASSGELQNLKDKWVGDIVQKADQIAEADADEKRKRESPKAISVTIRKVSGSWSMDSLDGFELVLSGEKGSYKSSPMNSGVCRFSAVPPGEYRLQMPISRVPATVHVPEEAKTSLAMDMSISTGGIKITWK